MLVAREDIQKIIFFKRNFPPSHVATKPQRESAQDRSCWAWADWHRGHVVSMRCGPWRRSTRNFWDPISTWLGEEDEHRIFVSVQFFRVTLVFWMLYTYISGWWFQICFILIPSWGNDPIWRAYVSRGLKPPTSYRGWNFSHFFEGGLFILSPWK